MSEITRFVSWDGNGFMHEDADGDYVLYEDHKAEVERVIADVVKLRIDLNSAQVAANQLRGEVERLTHERDEARDEAERLKTLLTVERDELATLRDRLRALKANGQGMLDTSCPTDEDIWREGFMRCLNDVAAEDWHAQADLVLATYRKRWPRLGSRLQC